jgi:hypothetical protein
MEQQKTSGEHGNETSDSILLSKHIRQFAAENCSEAVCQYKFQ